MPADGNDMTGPRITHSKASALAREIAEGRILREAVWEACEDRIAAREADVGAFSHHENPEARRKRWAEHDCAGPLQGLPVGIKDVLDTYDLPSEYGSPIYRGHRPARDAVSVALVRNAGGVVAGKTVTTEFATASPAATRNPLDLERTPGGSSSGSAAAVADGMLPLAIGTQTGGSIIRPASFCGIVGYKPTLSVVPAEGNKTFSWSFDTIGTYGRTVEDAAFLGQVMMGCELIPTGLEGAPRYGFCQTAMWDKADEGMRAAFERARTLAEGAGAVAKTVTLPQVFSDANVVRSIICEYEFAISLTYELRNHPDCLSDKLRARLQKGRAIGFEDYVKARRALALARRALLDIWTEVDVLVTPAAPGEAPKDLTTTGSSVFNRLWTGLGTPVVNVPGLTGDSGLPLGMQVIGPLMQDARTLAAAHFLEAALSPSD